MFEIRLFVSSVIAFPSGPKSHTFTVILAVFAPQPRWRHKLSSNLFMLLLVFMCCIF